MIYNEFKNLKISALAMGTMRLPVDGEGDVPINEGKTAEMVDYAIEHGVNYFDTAYGYHNGQSEVVMGRLLGKYPRDSYYLADKFPGYDLSNMDKVEAVLDEQLERCGVDYFDFYLLHNVYEKNIAPYLDEKYEILDYLLKQKKEGRIRHLGFSVHGEYDVLRRFLDACGDEMEFCQVQLNYLDWEFQAADKKLELLNERGISIIVMEPFRGGRLVKLSDESKRTLKAIRSDESEATLAYRFLQSLPGVLIVLTGASTLGQLRENVEAFEESRPLNDDEFNALIDAARDMASEHSRLLPCSHKRTCSICA